MALLSMFQLTSPALLKRLREETDEETSNLTQRFDVPQGDDVPADLKDTQGWFVQSKNGFRILTRILKEDILHGTENSIGILASMILDFVFISVAIVGIALYLQPDPDLPYYIGGAEVVLFGWLYSKTSAQMKFKEIRLGEHLSLSTSALATLMVFIVGGAYGLDSYLGGDGWYPLYALFPIVLLPIVTALHFEFHRNDLLKKHGEKHTFGVSRPPYTEARNTQYLNAKKDKSPFIQLGTTGGVFTRQMDGFSPDGGLPFGLSAQDLSKHLAIFGKTGGGKTYGELKPIAQQWLADKCGGALFLDGKGTLASELFEMFKGTSLEKEFVLVEPGLCDLGLIEGMSPEVLADTMADLGVGDPDNDKDKFFTSSGRKWLLSAACILKGAYDIEMKSCDEQAVKAGYANWNALEDDYKAKGKSLPIQRQYQWSYEKIVEMSSQKMTDKDFMRGTSSVMGLVDWIRNQHPDAQQSSLLRDALEFVAVEIPNMDDRTLGNVESTVKAWLTPIMTNAEIRKWAMVERGVDITKCLKGGILGVNAPSSKYQQAGTTVTALVKSRIFADIRNRGTEEKWRAKGHQPMLMMVDEAQEVIGVVEKSMVAVGRSLGICMVYATQSVDAYYAKFSEHETNAMLVNFCSILTFDSTELTAEYFQKRIGKPVTSSVSSSPLITMISQARNLLSTPIFDDEQSMNNRRTLKSKLIKKEIINQPFKSLFADDDEPKEKDDQYLLKDGIWANNMNIPYVAIAEVQRGGVPRRDVIRSIGQLTKDQLREMAQKNGIENPRI